SEAYKGSIQGDVSQITEIETFTSNAGNAYFDQKWAAVYEGVQRANSVLRIMREATDMTRADTIEDGAEARFLRAHYHFEAKKMWNKIPFVGENVTYDAGNFHIVNTDTWQYIENDLIYAMNNLPPTQAQIGRANKYAAEALLAKAYMFEHKFTEAKKLLDDLVTNGETSGGVKYKLLDQFQFNFNAQYKNMAESVFACQSSVNDGSGGLNGESGDALNFPQGGITGCCSFFQPSQYLVNHFKTDPSTGLPDLDTYNNVDVISDQNIPSGSPFTPYTGTLDPRLDWTVGRRGIPYLDWGVDPGKDWVRDQVYSGPYLPIKNVFFSAQQGMYTDNAWNVFTAINVNLIRFADVLLWAAEAEVEVGSLDKAEEYVNMVRARAANPDGFVHTYIDPANPGGGFTQTPAANYFIKTYPPGYFTTQGQTYARKAVRYERMLELAMEGHRFFDLVRWGIAATEINAYISKEKFLRTYMGTPFVPNKNEYYPIPQDQIDLSFGKMKQNPGY
ncbi:MAG TPA: RagB/SusD family nutrient uptake outer membrane protein, partial [Mucilaginibacter sp.]|nr:RagB/SusD family nutrient uptake outer membrane protein [Mucilaginibacter sp.]